MEQEMPKFKRRWRWIGKLVSEDGASIWYGYKSVYYSDQRGSFEFAFEDGILIPKPYQLEKERVPLTQSETDAMVERLAAGIKSDGRSVQIFKNHTSGELPVDCLAQD